MPENGNVCGIVTRVGHSPIASSGFDTKERTLTVDANVCLRGRQH